ncbi:hypothetical protein EfmJHP35_13920 [Enterococcus faecium]|nr:hypothetical protein EfmJHP35_13920 [Enterococcus faecium]
MSKRVIILNFQVESQAYQAFSEIKKLHAVRSIKGEQMAVVSHDPNGTHQFKIEDFIDFTGNNKSSTGGLIGKTSKETDAHKWFSSKENRSDWTITSKDGLKLSAI